MNHGYTKERLWREVSALEGRTTTPEGDLGVLELSSDAFESPPSSRANSAAPSSPGLPFSLETWSMDSFPAESSTERDNSPTIFNQSLNHKLFSSLVADNLDTDRVLEPPTPANLQLNLPRKSMDECLPPDTPTTAMWPMTPKSDPFGASADFVEDEVPSTRITPDVDGPDSPVVSPKLNQYDKDSSNHHVPAATDQPIHRSQTLPVSFSRAKRRGSAPQAVRAFAAPLRRSGLEDLKLAEHKRLAVLEAPTLRAVAERLKVGAFSRVVVLVGPGVSVETGFPLLQDPVSGKWANTPALDQRGDTHKLYGQPPARKVMDLLSRRGLADHPAAL
jgi:hypothetical protein